MEHRKEIDGLRAFAVLPVMLFHAGFQAFSGGFVGVDVFFVISGYLITKIIRHEQMEGKFSLLRFYERRARRILPGLFLVAVFCTAFSWLWLLPEQMKQFAQSLLSMCLFVSNIFFYLTTGYFGTASELKPLLHTWSLAVEEQFYLFFPLLLLGTSRASVRTLGILLSLIGIASLAMAQVYSTKSPEFAFFMLPTRIWELLIGALLVILPVFVVNRGILANERVRQIGGLIGLGLIAYAILAFDRATPFPGTYALMPTVGAACVILFSDARTHVGKFLGSKILAGLGALSYSAYLWHQPILAFARQRSQVDPSNAVYLALLAFTILVSYISWKYVEKPFREPGLIARSRLLCMCLFLIVFFVLFGLYGHFRAGYRSRFDESILDVERVSQEGRTRNTGCEPKLGNSSILSESCSLGVNSKIVGILIGDSHADALSGALGESLNDKAIGLENLSFPGCSPVVNLRLMKGDRSDCFEFNHRALEEVQSRADMKYVVIMARWTIALDGNGINLDNTHKSGNGFDNEEGGVEVLWRPRDSDADTQSDFKRMELRRAVRSRHVDTIRAFLRQNRKVVLVYPVPEAGWDVPSYLAKKLLFGASALSPSDGSTSHELYKRRNAEAIAILDSIGVDENLIRVKPEEVFCNSIVKGRCVTHIAGNPLYFDDDHLSHFGAKLIAAEIANKLVH